MRLKRTIRWILVWCTMAIGLHCMTACHAQSGRQLSTIDAQTRWAFRALSPVIVSSQIVRLRDVVKPLDSDMAAWDRLSRSPIGLVPLNGAPMTINRERLSKAIRSAEATAAAIDWIGPEEIEVIYRPGAPSNAPVYKTTYNQPMPAGQNALPATVSGLSKSASKTILTWIGVALDRQHESLVETFEVEFNDSQPGLMPLQAMVGVPMIEILDEPAEGACRIRVTGRSFDGPCESVITATLTAHPLVVFARKSFQRGHRIDAGDVIVQPLPESKLDPSYVTDPDDLIGLEVRGSIRENRPISLDDVGSPILVRRGDLIDIRVNGGGVTVTTRGKAMDEGANSDTIEVETLSPRKRLLARVVQGGLVEIVTRAPRVKQ